MTINRAAIVNTGASARQHLRRPKLIRLIRRLCAERERTLTLAQAKQMSALWPTAGWGADPALLVEFARRCRMAPGPVLECGSGLTTTLAGIYTDHGCWSLEHDPKFAARTRRVANRAKIPVRVLHAPLVSYDGFDWYQVPDGLPRAFALVLCDGPPSKLTAGGRFGLMPVMGDRISGATVILDDTGRPSEQALLGKWAGWISTIDERGSYAVLTVR